jgi:2,3,4,5-tetrahydropyridine-2-carboxylate N-succinyltransferase
MEEKTINTSRKVVDLLDRGELRVAEPIEDGLQVNELVKKQ